MLAVEVPFDDALAILARQCSRFRLPLNSDHLRSQQRQMLREPSGSAADIENSLPRADMPQNFPESRAWLQLLFIVGNSSVHLVVGKHELTFDGGYPRQTT